MKGKKKMTNLTADQKQEMITAKKDAIIDYVPSFEDYEDMLNDIPINVQISHTEIFAKFQIITELKDEIEQLELL